MIMSRRKQARPVRLLEDEDDENLEQSSVIVTETMQGADDNTNSECMEDVEVKVIDSNVIVDRTDSPMSLPPSSPIPAATTHHQPHIPRDLSQLHCRDERIQYPSIDTNCGENSNSSDEEEIVSGASGSLPPETHMCPRCHEQFQEVSEFLSHRQICDSKARRHHEPAHSDPEDMVVSGDEDEEESMVKQEEEVRRHRQDAANNNSVDEEEHGNPEQVFPFPVPPAGHVTLEALQNTKVAVAQFAATALANSDNSEAALQELAVLQSTLFTLQHQQVFQLQLINQLQQQLSLNRPKETTPPSPPVSEGVPPLPLSPPLIPTTSKTPPVVTPTSQSLPATTHPKPEISKTPTPAVVSVPSMSLSTQPPLCSISSSLASTIITNNDPPPSLDEPNTLEMLQRRAQEVLDNASQGLLASNLADELAFRKGKVSPYDSKSGRNEPFFKHRCRYCGKVFGSDSALQIHIRSHTGERPFKCNVCGSRFTTKGNLKVHFQRHTAKFPHIKMNPNPVPEHLDKYHPPLLQQLGQNRPGSPGIMPPHPPPPLQFPHFPPLYRPPPPPPSDLRPHGIPMEEPLRPIFLRREEQEEPQNLTKPRTPTPPPPPPRCKSEPLEEPAEPETPEIVPKEEPEPRTPTPTYDDCSMESKYSNEEMDQDQPENLSSKSQSTPKPYSHTPETSSGSFHDFPPPPEDPARDPAVYTTLLPRPGSQDNSWESLIEVTKTSETSKLQQLVDKIELTDPNQCVICHRVLSCKSALQMHYRTHTGERPFKCKICGRAFTTKGNLKTHMGVHRAKPPMRVLHQCPVCHKKFTNALVLQQHIRLHTGEPTDLTPEQIQAAEIRDFPGGFPLPNSMNPSLNCYPPGITPPYKPGDFTDDFLEDDEDDDDDHHTPPFSTSLAALENQVRTITTMASDDMYSNHSHYSRVKTSSPHNSLDEDAPRPPSSQRIPSPTESDSNSVGGALDLTPAQRTPPRSPSPQAHSTPIFPNFGQPPHLMTSTLSSLSSSVLTSTAFSPLGLAVGPAVRGNTTCNICFKTFACNSALEIHYRSHTKERPFKCGVCDRGFSTKSKSEECLCSSGQQGRIQDNGGPLKSKRKRPNERMTTTHSSSSALPTRWPPLMHPSSGYASASEWIRPFLLGNMKQHMLTHKIRDMPHHPGFPPPPGSFKEDGRNSFKDERGSSFKDDSRSSHTLPERPENYNSCSSEPPSQVLERDREREREQRDQHLPLPPDMPLLKNEMSLMKRSPSETDLPMPKRPPNLPTTPPSSGIALLRECVRFAGGGVSPIMQQQQAAAAAQNQANNQIPTSQSSSQQQNTKHLCHVCNKNFSSSSALQIHMRTHTGDKPFRCNVCQKAFTTKGNLKVHMGTHMWSNGASRRGRRMSLDLPPIPMTPKDSEFLQRRPDLFYPYLPAPFLNGMQQKLNEISVIQNPANGLPSPGKYASLLGFGYPPVSDPLRSQPSSPSSDKPPSSVASSSPPRDGSSEPPPSRPPPSQSRDVLPRVWDLHYDRQSAPEEGTVSPPSNGTINVPNPSQLGVPPSARGEGLAA